MSLYSSEQGYKLPYTITFNLDDKIKYDKKKYVLLGLCFFPPLKTILYYNNILNNPCQNTDIWYKWLAMY